MGSLFFKLRHPLLHQLQFKKVEPLASSSSSFSRRFKSSSLTWLFSSSSGAEIEKEYTQSQSQNQSLTQEELASINLLIPRLCFINQLATAIRLISAALLLPHPPPLHSLSLPVLIHSLSSQPDLSLSASLLTRLQRSSPPQLTPVATLLIVYYLKNRRPRDALQLFDDWLMRPGSSSCLPHPASSGLLLGAFCRNGMVFEALKVLSAMLASNVIPGSNLRRSLHRSLLREARIAEAVELDRALAKASSDRTGGGKREAALLLDRIFRDWTE
ncbi:uncharacterized protein LOC116209544 [Punica granatum]|nr:uncharacterized protein LOC116209544 [Punica granatum]XP_031399063.1 uncharacterized protein LOC116209544 [Punica granatum]PKI71216.1 hypothetical protein CRG98_008391 [Punica granatum]